MLERAVRRIGLLLSFHRVFFSKLNFVSAIFLNKKIKDGMLKAGILQCEENGNNFLKTIMRQTYYPR